MPKTAYIGLGSNIGDRMANCLKALDLLGSSPFGPVTARSAFYKTEPQGLKDQEWFINAVCALEVSSSPWALLEGLLSIEGAMGRVRKEKWGPRLIDLDILLFGEEIIRGPDLIIPHPLMHCRRFVLVPLLELLPYGVHPVLGKPFSELLETIDQEGQRVAKIEG